MAQFHVYARKYDTYVYEGYVIATDGHEALKQWQTNYGKNYGDVLILPFLTSGDHVLELAKPKPKPSIKQQALDLFVKHQEALAHCALDRVEWHTRMSNTWFKVYRNA